MTQLTGDGGLAAETRYVWSMARGLAGAKTPDEVSEYREALTLVTELTEFAAVRFMALKILTRVAPEPSLSAVVRLLVRNVAPAALAVAVTACAWAAVPAQVDPPIVVASLIGCPFECE